MSPFTSKELYMMNGGNKLYIHKDGFGDIYKATAAEEAEWAGEFIARTLVKIGIETNAVSLKFAIDSLQFHKYPALNSLLISQLNDTSPIRQIVFATALWAQVKYENSFGIILQQLISNRNQCLDQVFLSLKEFGNNGAVKMFLLSCLQGSDHELFIKAHQAISMWAWFGFPALRENNLLEFLRFENRHLPSFNPAVMQLKRVFFLK